MSAERQDKGRVSQLSSTQIARATFAAAESMGISDRERIERLTRQVIERLEQKKRVISRGNMSLAQPLPGMEDLMPASFRQQKHLTSESEILALVKEFLDEGEPATQEEEKSELKVRKNTDVKIQSVAGLQLTENALRVLEKRYLSKDKAG